MSAVPSWASAADATALTGPQNYLEAARLAAYAEEFIGDADPALALAIAGLAQVHATLALVAITASGGGTHTGPGGGWTKVLNGRDLL